MPRAIPRQFPKRLGPSSWPQWPSHASSLQDHQLFLLTQVTLRESLPLWASVSRSVNKAWYHLFPGGPEAPDRVQEPNQTLELKASMDMRASPQGLAESSWSLQSHCTGVNVYKIRASCPRWMESWQPEHRRTLPTTTDVHTTCYC